ncbi:hypothetical protein WA016_05880 [Myxococcus stipitatus]
MRWMRTLTLGGLVMWGGCTESKVDEDQDILIKGKAIDESGAPLSETLLKIHRGDNSACSLAIFSSTWRSVKTRTDGTFELDLLGADTRSGSFARCFIIASPTRAEGRGVSASFLVQASEVALPTLQEWTGTLTATAAAQGVSVNFRPLSATHGAGEDEYTLAVRGPNVFPIWAAYKVTPPVSLSDYALEDAANLKAVASAERDAKVGDVTVDLSYSSDTVALPRRTRVPVSRGATCTYVGAELPCRLTNGDLGNVVNFQSGVREVSFRLPRAVVPRKAVLRNFVLNGSMSELVLEGSADGTQWASLANLLAGAGAQAFMEVDLTGTTAVSQVRIRAVPRDATSDLRSLAQLSLFE